MVNTSEAIEHRQFNGDRGTETIRGRADMRKTMQMKREDIEQSH